jgi:hypothetical protein
MSTAETASGQMTGKRDAWITLGLGLGFLILYLRTLCPTVYLGDTGDFCTAFVTGGVPHPPGYPLFSLLGRAALALVPCGEPAFRIGCTVAAAAAAAVAVVYLLARELGCSPWSAAIGAANYGTGYTFWSQATRVEVYALHILLTALLLLATLRYRRTGRLTDLAAGAMAGSLGLAHHLTIVLLAPAVLALCGRRLWNDPGRGRRLALVAALLPLGPVLYLLLLVWARAEPLHAWGHTVTLPLLWNHASARLYRAWFLQIPTGAVLSQRLAQAGSLFLDNFPYFSFLLPLLGAGLLWRREREPGASLLLAGAAVVAYNLCYGIDDIAPYYLTVWMVAASLLAVAANVTAVHAASAGKRPALAGAALVLLIGLPLLRNWRACDLSRATWVREFARQKLEDTASHGVLITQGVDDTFPIWYVQDVLKVRPDVTAIDRRTTKFTWVFYPWDPSLWYLYRLRREGVDAPLHLPRDPAARAVAGDDEYLVDLLNRELRGRPICLAFSVPDASSRQDPPSFSRWVHERYRVVPAGIALQLYPKNQPVNLNDLLAKNDRLWSSIALPDLRGVRMDQDLDPDCVLNQYAGMLTSLGGLHQAAGDMSGAGAIYRRAEVWAPHFEPAAAALASLRHSGVQAFRRSGPAKDKHEHEHEPPQTVSTPSA